MLLCQIGEIRPALDLSLQIRTFFFGRHQNVSCCCTRQIVPVSLKMVTPELVTPAGLPSLALLSANRHIDSESGKLVVLKNSFLVSQQIVERTDKKETKRQQIQQAGAELAESESVDTRYPDKAQKDQEKSRIGAPALLPIGLGELPRFGVIQILDNILHILELRSVELRQMV